MHTDKPIVLLISDKESYRDSIDEQFASTKGHHYGFEVAETLAVGINRLANRSVAAILLDMILPDSAGLDTLLHCYAKADGTPIVVLTDDDEEELGIQALGNGATEYLVHGQFDGNLLIRTLRYATERNHTLQTLKMSEAKYRGLYETVASGIFQSTPDGKFLAANPALVRMLGYDSEDEILKVDIADSVYMYSEDRDNWLNAICKEGEIRNSEMVLKRKDGSKIVVVENSSAVTDNNGRIMYFEGALINITEVHELSNQLSYESSHDSLTSLINRREFEVRLQRLVESNQLKRAKHAICYLDLDQFKVINDTCGHIAGDELLCQVGKVLQNTIREGDTVARLGGDEFGVILENCSSEHAARIADYLREAIENLEFVWSDVVFTIGVSIGVVPLTPSNLRLTEILSAADSACYAAKDQGRNRVQLYNPNDTVVAQRHGEMQWVSRIKRALEENRFHLFYQPIVPINPAMGEDTHYEILIRMEDKRGRMILPGEFLPAVERYNLAVRLDTWVLKTTLSWLTSNPEHFEGGAQFFINLSGDTIGDESFHNSMLHMLQKMGMPPQKFCFEVTETAAISNISSARAFIELMRNEGCNFALDDFGSGLCSFAYLQNLPVDYIKIDGIFIRDVDRNPVNAAMVKSIKEIGQVMGKKVIAEHVESKESLAYLESIGVDYAQGYALGKPRPIADLAFGKSENKHNFRTRFAS